MLLLYNLIYATRVVKATPIVYDIVQNRRQRQSPVQAICRLDDGETKMLVIEKKIDPRVKRTRQLLEQSFMDLMHEKSFHSITVQDVTERATVNRATFYDHFEDKYALLEACMRDAFNQVLRSKVPADASLSNENLKQLLLALCELQMKVHGECSPPRHEFEPLMEKQIKQQISEVLVGWLREAEPGARHNRTSPELTARVTSWAIYGASYQWSLDERKQPPEQFADQVMPMILAGLEASKE